MLPMQFTQFKTEPQMIPQLSSLARKVNTMEILIPLGLIAAWVILQAWILPWFGVQT